MSEIDPVSIVFAGVDTATHPELVLVVGQPGSGTSRVARIVLDEHPTDIASVSAENFAALHPDFLELTTWRPLEASGAHRTVDRRVDWTNARPRSRDEALAAVRDQHQQPWPRYCDGECLPVRRVRNAARCSRGAAFGEFAGHGIPLSQCAPTASSCPVYRSGHAQPRVDRNPGARARGRVDERQWIASRS